MRHWPPASNLAMLLRPRSSPGLGLAPEDSRVSPLATHEWRHTESLCVSEAGTTQHTVLGSHQERRHHHCAPECLTSSLANNRARALQHDLVPNRPVRMPQTGITRGVVPLVTKRATAAGKSTMAPLPRKPFPISWCLLAMLLGLAAAPGHIAAATEARGASMQEASTAASATGLHAYI